MYTKLTAQEKRNRKMLPELLPDELWIRIMEIGIETETLDHKSICHLSATCRRFRRLTADNTLWWPLLVSSYTNSNNPFSSTTVKTLFKIRYVERREHGECVKEFAQMKENVAAYMGEMLQHLEDLDMHADEVAILENAAAAP